jgi:hypothetical protein
VSQFGIAIPLKTRIAEEVTEAIVTKVCLLPYWTLTKITPYIDPCFNSSLL